MEQPSQSLEQENRIMEPRVLVTFAGGPAQLLSFDDFSNLLRGQRNNNDRFFSCYLIRDGDADSRDALEIPMNIIKAMFETSIHAVDTDITPDAQNGGTVDNENLDDLTSDGICNWLSSLGENVYAGLKGMTKLIGKVYDISELLEGAFGPLRTKEKVEKCLTRIGCLLIVLSLVLFLIVAANGRFTHGKTSPRDKSTSTSWRAVTLYGISLTIIFGWGLRMVSMANEMASIENYTDGDGQGTIIAAIWPLIIFTAVLAFV